MKLLNRSTHPNAPRSIAQTLASCHPASPTPRESRGGRQRDGRALNLLHMAAIRGGGRAGGAEALRGSGCWPARRTAPLHGARRGPRRVGRAPAVAGAHQKVRRGAGVSLHGSRGQGGRLPAKGGRPCWPRGGGARSHSCGTRHHPIHAAIPLPPCAGPRHRPPLLPRPRPQPQSQLCAPPPDGCTLARPPRPLAVTPSPRPSLVSTKTEFDRGLVAAVIQDLWDATLQSGADVEAQVRPPADGRRSVRDCPWLVIHNRHIS
jgi:hypothetical protein